MSKEQDKEFERLKWDYWNKSPLFKSLWVYYRTKKLDPSTPFPDQFKKDKIKHEPFAPPYFVATREYWFFWLYHDPETASFDDYSKFKEKERRKFKTEKYIYVEDYREQISKDFDIAVNWFKRKNNKNPKINEVREYLLKWIKEHNRSFYLKINQYDFTNTEADKILEEVGIILKERTRGKKPEPKTIRQYLQAWELRHENKPQKTYLEIFKTLKMDIKTKEKDEREIRKRKAQKATRYVFNAETIIRNLEAGKSDWWKLERQKRDVYEMKNPQWKRSGY